MKYKKLVRNYISFFLALLILTSCVFISANAISTIDTTQKGSLTLYAYDVGDDNPQLECTGEDNDLSSVLENDYEYTPIQGVVFEVKRVVTDTFINAEGKSYYSASGIALPTVSEVQNSLNTNDGKFTVSGTYTTFAGTNAAGKVTLTNLSLGIYLIHVSSTPASVTTRANDFLVSIPTTKSNKTEWNYNVTVYPKFINGVKLTYDANNGSGNQTSERRIAENTEPLTENVFTNGSKIFLGWADNASDTTPDYFDKQDFTMPNQDKTIYAVWGYTSTIRYYTSFKYSEPWGLNLSIALINPNTNAVIDYSNYNNYGIYILPKNSISNDTPSLSEMITQGRLYSNTNSEWNPTSLTFNDGKTDNYPTLTYDEDIFTHNLKDDIFTLTYITYKGRTFWGTVKNRAVEKSVESIISSQQVGYTTFSEAEVQLATAIKNMYDAEYTFFTRQNKVVPTHPAGEKLSDNDNAARFSNVTKGQASSYEYCSALRGVDPWGMKLQAKVTAPNNEEVDEQGVLVYVDTKRALLKNEKNLTYNDLLNKDDTLLYSTADENASMDGDYITAHYIGIYTYRLAQTDIYTSFYVKHNNNVWFTPVKRRNCYEFANEHKNSTTGLTQFGTNYIYRTDTTLASLPKTFETTFVYNKIANKDFNTVWSCPLSSGSLTLYINQSGSPMLYCSANRKETYNWCGTTLTDGSKNTFTVTLNGSSYKAFLNGTQVYSGSISNFSSGRENFNMTLGSVSSTSSNSWMCYCGSKICSFHAFSDIRTNDEILQDYEDGVKANEDGLLFGRYYEDQIAYAVYDNMINLYNETYYYKNGHYPTFGSGEVTEH